MTDEKKVNRIRREPYRAYPALDARPLRTGRLLASAASAGIIAGASALSAAVMEGGGHISAGAIVLAVLFGLTAAAKDYRTYIAAPPVHNSERAL